MTLALMLPGLVAGGMEEALGYRRFFLFTLVTMAATWAVVAMVRRRMGYMLANEMD